MSEATWRPAPSYDINTVAGLIDAMGGSQAVAGELDLDHGETRRWEVSGCIPAGWHLRLFAKALVLKHSVAPAVFDLPADGEEWQALAGAAALRRETIALSMAVSSPRIERLRAIAARIVELESTEGFEPCRLPRRLQILRDWSHRRSDLGVPRQKPNRHPRARGRGP